MDLDGDGRDDVVSGSSPGQIYWFRRLGGMSFAPAEILKGEDGKPIVLGSATVVCAADWNGDGRADLVVGTGEGKVYMLPNRPGRDRFVLGPAVAMEVKDDREEIWHAAPVVADWDDDGRLDLLLGDRDGSVYWYRNIGSALCPKLAAGECLVPQGPGGTVADRDLRPGQWGICSKPCAADWNADGRLDLLLGDCCGSFVGKRLQSAAELAEELRAVQQLPVLRHQWAEAFAEYRELLQAQTGGERSPEQLRRRAALLARIQQLKDEMAKAQETINRYAPQRQHHGFVWLFLRRPVPDQGPGPQDRP